MLHTPRVHIHTPFKPHELRIKISGLQHYSLATHRRRTPSHRCKRCPPCYFGPAQSRPTHTPATHGSRSTPAAPACCHAPAHVFPRGNLRTHPRDCRSEVAGIDPGLGLITLVGGTQAPRCCNWQPGADGCSHTLSQLSMRGRDCALSGRHNSPRRDARRITPAATARTRLDEATSITPPQPRQPAQLPTR